MPDTDPREILTTILSTDAGTRGPAARLVHLTIAALAIQNDSRRVETTVHTLAHLTGLLPVAVEAVLGHNALELPLFPATVQLDDDIVTVQLDDVVTVQLPALTEAV